VLHRLHTCSGFGMWDRQFGRSCSDGGHGRSSSPPLFIVSAAGCKIQEATMKIGRSMLGGVEASVGRLHEEDDCKDCSFVRAINQEGGELAA
jgi:hypothetical protein